MPVKLVARTFEVKYLNPADRLLLTVRLSPSEQLGMQLTRRLTRNFISALLRAIKQQPQVSSMPNEVTQDAVMGFQHSHSVSEAKSTGTLRKKLPDESSLVDGGAIHDITISRRSEHESALVFSSDTHILSIHIPMAHLHIILEMLMQISRDAEWDFAPMAAWLENLESAPPPASRIVN